MRYTLHPESNAAHEAYSRLTEPIPYPVPHVRSCDPWPDGFKEPSAVASLTRVAVSYGWRVIKQYSRGFVPHATTGRPGALRHLVGVRIAHGLPAGDPDLRSMRQAYAVYSSPVSRAAWTWPSIWIWGPDLPPFGMCGVTELLDYLATPYVGTDEVLAWTDEIRQRRAGQAAATKEREAERRLTAVAKPKTLEGL